MMLCALKSAYNVCWDWIRFVIHSGGQFHQDQDVRFTNILKVSLRIGILQAAFVYLYLQFKLATFQSLEINLAKNVQVKRWKNWSEV